MIRTREEYENLERSWLAPYAMKSADSRGRKYPELEHPYRSAFQRDRESIIHTTHFRRLKYKTQVFVYYEGDAYRTRLTHTLEVAQIARTIARALVLNEDLTEAIALAHDLGHPPFGHAGEFALRELMKEYGGFEHNWQALRVVEKLEERESNRSFAGLNLTWEVREGIIKHETRNPMPDIHHDFEMDKMASLESQIVPLADSIAYRNHDLDDGLRGEFFSPEDVDAANLEIWTNARKDFKGVDITNAGIRRHLISSMINLQVTDLIQETDRRLRQASINSINDVRNCRNSLVGFSPEMEHEDTKLGNFLGDALYHHYRVERMFYKAERCITDLYSSFMNTPELLPTSVQKYVEQDGLPRALCDYLAGMTDPFALSEHGSLFRFRERD